MRICYTVLVLMLAISDVHAQQKAPSANATFTVAGMTCAACAKTLESVAKKIDGVTLTAVDYPKRTATITFDSTKTSAEQLAKLLTRRTGMKTVPQPSAK